MMEVTCHFPELEPKQRRLVRLLERFVREEDADLSDADFVRALHERFEKNLRAPVIDVNE